ncbi:MAG: methylmalonyl-CoA mutase subunit beta, partial [Planctomycetota bacterium]
MFSDNSSHTDVFEPVSSEQWQAAVEKDLKGIPFKKKLVTHTYEGIDLNPLYTKGDWDGSADLSGFAGMAPMTRGSLPLGMHTCGWDIRQERAEPEADSLNARLLDDLEHGVTSVLLRLDAATRRGVDVNAPASDKLAGLDGAMLPNLEEFERAFQGVHLGMIGVALEAGAGALPAAAALAALCKKQGLSLDKAWLAFNCDPLAVLARDGMLPGTLEDLYEEMAALSIWAEANAPRATTIRVGSAPYHHAGATAAQDLAFSMATGVEYLRRLTEHGMSVDAAANQMLFSYVVGTNFFLAASKLRAARRLWSRIVEASNGSESAQRMRMHVRTSKRVITQRDPWVNMLRNTVCCFAAGMVGADSVTLPGFDAAIGHPSPMSARIARNTQIILQEESHLHRVVDPAGGSWFIESLTDELAQKAWAIFQEIEWLGGMSVALTTGWIHDQIDSAFAPRAKNIATRRDAVLGVSEFANVAESKPDPARYPIDELREKVRSRLQARKRADAITGWLDRVRASSGPARVDAAIAAIGAGVTLGEVSSMLERGEWA